MMLAGVRAVGGAVVVVVGGRGSSSSSSSGWRRLSTGQEVLSQHTFRKLLVKENNKKSKRIWHTHEGLPRVDNTAATVPASGVGAGKTKMPKNLPRLRALNKIYKDKISDILSTGELASHLYGRGLELSEVRLHPDLKGINVYWVASGEPQKDREMEEMLNGHAREVRHQLSALRLIGESPPITFVRDYRHHKLQEVERLLATADYGEDFVPTDPSHHLRASIITTSNTVLHPSLKAAIEDFDRQMDTKEREEEEEQEQFDPFEEALQIASTWPQHEAETLTAAATATTPTTTTTTTAANAATVTLPPDLPVMRDDVLGVNTSRIYKTIQKNMNRARADHRRQLGAHEEAGVDSDIPFSPSKLPYSPSIINRSKDIQQWASRYKQMQRKEARNQNKEMAMLSNSFNWQGYGDEEGEDEVEIHWVEELEEEEFQ